MEFEYVFGEDVVVECVFGGEMVLIVFWVGFDGIWYVIVEKVVIGVVCEEVEGVLGCFSGEYVV